jgi:DNA helicase II / ATP-dependent DNA helicase PcrA
MSEEKHKDWQIEQDHVTLVVNEIDAKISKLMQKSGTVGTDVLELRQNFWEDVTVNLDEPDDVIETHTSLRQQAELLAERERNQFQIQRQLKTLARQKNSPYFGRIDFLEEEEKQKDTIYIGIASFMDKEDENFLIYDWRAPISSLYYDHSPGPAAYLTPTGSINGEMELKRQFIIKNSQITGMFDTGVTIGDEMLQAVLGNNADAQMKSIVATIQREQNQIIRNEKSQIVVVQGVAGSGKTSAALQRIAYLLYRYRDSLSSENIMLFSPNQLFNSYVSTVLPELGEENMKQSTYQEYLDHRLSKEFELEDPFDQMEYLLTEFDNKDYQIRLASIHYKASLDFKNTIDQHVEKLSDSGLVFKDILFRKKIIISKEQIYTTFYGLDHTITIPNRIQLVKQWLLRELRKRAKIEQKKQWVEEEVQFLDKDDFLEAFQKLESKGRYNEDSFNDFELEQKLLAEMVVKQKFKPLFNRVKKLKFIDMNATYQQLFKYSDANETKKGISTLTLSNLKQKKISYEDATPFVYMQDLIIGRSSNPMIRHIFIDEAQDYTPFQFAFIKQLFPYSKMTLLGDVNQSIFFAATESLTNLGESFEKSSSVETYVLNRTYRSTKPIALFTNHLLEDGHQIEPFNREGNAPTAYTVGDTKDLPAHISEQVKSYRQKGHQTIAIICKTAQESRRAFDLLKVYLPIRLIEKRTLSYELGIVVIPSYLAKGIEFDAVIIYDSSKYSRETERKLFYTACTRAMHELHIASVGTPSPLITNGTLLNWKQEEAKAK